MSSELALHNLNEVVDSIEHVEAKLSIARRNGAPKSVITDLQTRLLTLGDKMNQLWDAWNDAMQAERLARIYG